MSRPEPEDRHPTPHHPVRILFAEDDLDQAHLVKFLLEAGGDHSVTLAQDGDRALELLEDHDWDLLITDLNLPGAHGTRVVNAARTARPDLPILATTGYTGPEYSQRAVELGADRVLIKPLDRDELLEQVRRLVEEGRPRRGTSSPSERRPAEPAPDPQPRRTAESAGRTAAAALRASHDPAPAMDEDPAQVLAVSVHPGDAEAGCGGALLRHLERGDRVVLLHVTRRMPGDAGRMEGTFARRAARQLGARSFVGNVALVPGEEEGAPGLEELRRLVEGAVREVRPDVLYVPTPRHRGAAHRAAHDAALGAVDADATCLAYDAGAVTLSFAPGLVVPFDSEMLERKIRVLEAYDGHPVPHLDPGFVRAAARYWGRFTPGRTGEAYEHLGGPAPFADTTPEDPGRTNLS